MSARKHAQIYYWFRIFIVLLLIGLVLPAGSALAQGPTTSLRKAEALKAGFTPITDVSIWNSNPDSAALMSGNLIQDGSFEAYDAYWGNDPYWTEYDSFFGTPLCSGADCGYFTYAHPYNGYAWAWFGGVTLATHTASISQSVFIPKCTSATLQFYFWIGYAASKSGSNDVFRAKIDGVPVFSATAAQKSSYASYKLVTVNVSSFANGAGHTVEFSHVNTGQNVDFNLDDVSLVTNCVGISGNAGSVGATISNSDGASVISGADGSYSMSVDPYWTGTVTPTHPCFTFSPTSHSYYNLTSSTFNEDFQATFNPASGCANVDISIGGTNRGKFGLAAATSAHGTYGGLVNGPVKVVSTNSKNIITSQRAIYGNSFNEMMGYPSNQFVKEYWFPWYDQVNMGTWILVGNPSTTQTAYVDIYIGGVKRNDTPGGVPYAIPANGRITPQYAGVVDGPVRVVSVTGSGTTTPLDIFASERSIYASSFNEVMGYPASQFVKEYWFPWYDQVNMGTWILVGNPSDTQTAYVDIYIGGAKVNDTPGGVPYAIPANGRITPQFPGIVNGPVRVVSVTGDGTASPINIFTSERSIYVSSFSEVMGVPLDQFTTTYLYPWYQNDSNLGTWILVGNPSETQTAYVDIYIGGVKRNDTPGGIPYALAPNGRITPQFNLNTGPVKIVSVAGDGTPTPIKIFTSERAVYGPSFNEMMGYSADQLTTEYWFTWYDSVNMNTEIYAGMP